MARRCCAARRRSSGSPRPTAAASGCSPATTTSSQMSKDWETYSSEVGGTSLEDLTPEEVEARKSMLDTDPPAHTRLRALVNKGFTPRVVNTYEERIRGPRPRDPRAGVRARRVRLGRGRRLGDPDVGLLGDHGPARSRTGACSSSSATSSSATPTPRSSARRTCVELTRSPTRRSACCPFSSPFATRADRVRLQARRGPARRSARRHHDEARRGRARRLAAERARVRARSSSSSRPRGTRRRGTRSASGCSTCSPHPEELARLIADPSLAGTAADEILRRAHPVHHFRRTATTDVDDPRPPDQGAAIR